MEDWSYDFKIVLGMQSPEMKNTLEVIDDYPEEMDVRSARGLDTQRADTNLAQRSAELLQIPAKLLVKSVAEEDGTRAWQKL